VVFTPDRKRLQANEHSDTVFYVDNVVTDL
jgi:hypothetical protein